MADSTMAMAGGPVTDPNDEVRIILTKYLANQIGASGVDSQIMKILVRRGPAG